MATIYPYISSAGPIAKTIDRLRKQFPVEVTADTLKKLGIAPKNESYVINILKFLDLVDDNGKKVVEKARAFLLNDDVKFAAEFEKVVKPAYQALFELYGEDAWTQSRDDLVSFFRTSDSSSNVVGRRQAITFEALAAMSGHGEIAPLRATTSKSGGNSTKSSTVGSTTTKRKPDPVAPIPPSTPKDSVGLTVRIEVNLPANGDQKTYDAIFQSIRKNLIDGS